MSGCLRRHAGVGLLVIVSAVLGCERSLNRTGDSSTDEPRLAACESCLPAGLKLSSELFFEPDVRAKGKGVTVRAILREHAAYCKDGTIYDGGGKPMVFRQIQWEGPPPTTGEGENHWAVKQAKMLAELKERYVVITYCEVIP
jgi:hypothetical protein